MEGGHLAALRLHPLHPYEATTTSVPRRFVISAIRSAFLSVYIRARSAAVKDSDKLSHRGCNHPPGSQLYDNLSPPLMFLE